jgi:hypothetical protein
MSSKSNSKATNSPDEGSLVSPVESTIPEPTAIDTVVPPATERKSLNLNFAKSRPGLPGLIPRPIDPSPVRVSHTVSIAGTRPVMADPRKIPDVLRQAPKILNRPIAPNQTEDSNRLLEYLD